MQDVRIVKSKLHTDYTIIPNEILRRSDMSAKAKGLFCYLISLPADWKIYKKQINTNFKDGYDGLNTAFKELEEKGYLVVNQVASNSGRFAGMEYILYMYPYGKKEEKTVMENPHRPVRKIPTGTDTENPELLSTNLNKVNKQREIFISEIDIQKIYTLYPSRCPLSSRSTSKSKSKHIDKIRKLKTSYVDLKKLIELYVNDCKKSKTYLKNFETFLNNLPDIDEIENNEKKNEGMTYNLKIS